MMSELFFAHIKHSTLEANQEKHFACSDAATMKV